MILAGCAGGPLTELAAGRIDSDGGVAAFVRVDSDDHHGRVSLHQTGDCDRSGGHLSVGATPRSYQATPGRSATPPAAQLDEATTGRKWWSEPMTPPDRDTEGSGVRVPCRWACRRNVTRPPRDLVL